MLGEADHGDQVALCSVGASLLLIVSCGTREQVALVSYLAWSSPGTTFTAYFNPLSESLPSKRESTSWTF